MSAAPSASAREPMIEAKGLKRTYAARGKTVEAVRGVDITVHAREIVGFLGPNGAGKTTTLKMLATLLAPTGGTARIAGCDLRTDPVGVRRAIGYVSQAGSTSSEARAGEEIVSHARFYGIGRADAERRARELLSALDLSDIWERKCGSLSGGQRRRLDIVMGLIHEPKLVFLDEPSTGLDPQSRANLWTHIEQLRDRLGTTVFITTHYMDEADALSDRLLVIDQGTIVAQGTPDELKHSVRGDIVTFGFADSGTAERARTLLAEHGAAEPVTGAPERIALGMKDGSRAVPGLIGRLASAGLETQMVDIDRPTLDDVFLTLTGRSLRD